MALGTQRLASLALAFALFAPGLARAEAHACGADTTELRRVLSARHDPPNRERLEAMCSDATPALIGVAVEPARQIERLRAIFALGSFPTAEVRTVLAGLATNADESASIRRTALVALDHASEGDSAILLRTARAALHDADAHVRNAAVRCLADHPEARRDLTIARRSETEAFVRTSIDEALATPAATDRDEATVRAR